MVRDVDRRMAVVFGNPVNGWVASPFNASMQPGAVGGFGLPVVCVPLYQTVPLAAPHVSAQPGCIKGGSIKSVTSPVGPASGKANCPKAKKQPNAPRRSGGNRQGAENRRREAKRPGKYNSQVPEQSVHANPVDRWADEESDEDDAAPTQLHGRALKRHQQRIRRREGRIERWLARTGGNPSNANSNDISDSIVERKISMDGSTTAGSVQGSGPEQVNDAELSNTSDEEQDERMDIEFDDSDSQDESDERFLLPRAVFKLAPDSEQFRVAYRCVRLGKAAGASGRLSHTPFSVDGMCSTEFWRRLRTSLSHNTAEIC